MIPRLLLLNLVISMLALELVAQSPTPSASGTAPVLDDKRRKSSPAAPASTPAPGGAPTPAKFVATPSPSPTATLSTEALINSLNAADLQAAMTLLKNNFTNPESINETQLNRATLQGLIIRLGPGLMLLPDKGSASPEPPAPFYGELLEGHICVLAR